MGMRFKVREIAEARKISQRQLFFRSQVDLKTIQKLFRQPTSTIITTETLDKLATALNVDVSLLIESDPPLPKTLEEL
jgi:transcriptional regulator with XRE-family HTH domain